MTTAFYKLRRYKGVIALISFFIIFSGGIHAQDSQYWNLQYGTKATLLGGAVIGSVSDLSATYYNPGAVSLFENPKLIVSAKVYEYERIKIENGAGADKDLVSDKFSTAPNFFAMKLRKDTIGKSKWAISVLTRQNMNFDFTTRTITNSIGSSGDTSIVSGLFRGYEYLNEMWGGLTYSYKLNEMLGVGVTAYGAYRYQTIQRQCIVDKLKPDNTIQSFENIRNFNYTNYRALLKAGVAVKSLPFTFGLNVTTPSLSVAGNGSFGYCKVMSDPDSVQNNVYQTDYQDSLESVFRSSWAVGIGAAYWHERYNIHFSAEWFNAIKRYDPIRPDRFVAQSSGEVISSEVVHDFSSVLNVGAGFVYLINESTDISAGITTDFSANQASRRSSVSMTKWDIYHINAGSNFKIGKSEITLGMSYSFGSDAINQQIDLTDSSGIENPVSPDVQARFKRVKLLLGFIF